MGLREFFTMNSPESIRENDPAKYHAMLQAELKLGKSPEQKRCIDFLSFKDFGCRGCARKSQVVPTTDMTADEYMSIIKRKIEELSPKQRALKKLGLPESDISVIEPILVSGYVFDEKHGTDKTALLEGGAPILSRTVDGYALSSRFSLSWLFFSKEELFTYTYVFETISDNTYEELQEFFYRDVISIESKRTHIESIAKFEQVAGCKDYFKFQTITSGCKPSMPRSGQKSVTIVDSLEIQLTGKSFDYSLTESPDLEDKIRKAKALIRARKEVK